MRLPSHLIGPDTFITIPNAMQHPLIAKYGIKRYTFNAWRKDGKLGVYEISQGEKQKFWKTTLRQMLLAIGENFGVDVKADLASLDAVSPKAEE